MLDLISYQHPHRRATTNPYRVVFSGYNHFMVTPPDSSYRLISDHQFAAVRINLANHQKGFFAQQSYRAGDVVTAFGAAAVLPTATYLTVQIGEAQHIILLPEHLQYINHGCDPNVVFDTASMEIIAIKDIFIGDEMTFFYPSTEWDMSQPFQCHCGSFNCLGEIQGAAHLPVDVLKQYKLSSFIQQQLHDRAHREDND